MDFFSYRREAEAIGAVILALYFFGVAMLVVANTSASSLQANSSMSGGGTNFAEKDKPPKRSEYREVYLNVGIALAVATLGVALDRL